MQASVVLTVAESKRLIAQGVAAWPSVQRALQEGLVIIATGTTNAYVVEEILGKSINKAAYVTGRTIPATVDATGRFPKPMPDVILQRGEVVEGLDRFTAVKQLQPGDVFIKGANALNYERKIAGIAVGHPEGGTVGAAYGPLIARRATWVIPVGLEKLVAHDITEVARRLMAGEETLTAVPTLFPVTGEIITEIEALQILTGVEVYHLGSGGILGAEGSVRLLLSGERENVEEALRLVKDLQGEPPFWGGET